MLPRKTIITGEKWPVPKDILVLGVILNYRAYTISMQQRFIKMYLWDTRKQREKINKLNETYIYYFLVFLSKKNAY